MYQTKHQGFGLRYGKAYGRNKSILGVKSVSVAVAKRKSSKDFVKHNIRMTQLGLICSEKIITKKSGNKIRHATENDIL